MDNRLTSDHHVGAEIHVLHITIRPMGIINVAIQELR